MAACTIFTPDDPVQEIPHGCTTQIETPIAHDPRHCVGVGTIVNLATWDITGYAGGTGSVASASAVDGLTVGAIEMGAGLTENAEAGSFTTQGWDEYTMDHADRTAYYEWSIQTDGTHYVDLTALYCQMLVEDPGGPWFWKLVTDADGYAIALADWQVASGNPPVGLVVPGVSLRIPAGTTRIFRMMAGVGAVSFDGNATATANVRLKDLDTNAHMGMQGRVYTTP
jgi:hypothetical protein